MAYVKSLKFRCAHYPTCQKQAAIEVFNHRNSSLGRYCLKDGARKLKLQQAIEKEE